MPTNNFKTVLSTVLTTAQTGGKIIDNTVKQILKGTRAISNHAHQGIEVKKFLNLFQRLFMVWRKM